MVLTIIDLRMGFYHHWPSVAGCWKKHVGKSAAMNPMPVTNLTSIFGYFRLVRFGLEGILCRWYRKWLIVQQIHGSTEAIQKLKKGY